MVSNTADSLLIGTIYQISSNKSWHLAPCTLPVVLWNKEMTVLFLFETYLYMSVMPVISHSNLEKNIQ